MSLESLLSALSREAEAQIESDLAGARAEAEAITSSARERTERRRAELAAVRDAERHAAVEVTLLAARRDSARELLDAQRAFLERVFAAVRPTLVDALTTSAYRNALPGLLADALASVGGRQISVRGHPRMLADLRAAIAPLANTGVEGDETLGAGFRIIADGGAVEVDCTLEGRLAALAPRLSIEILEQLEKPL
jgi:vacuolar-type H+-ATPase subunit E/Vma4